MIASSKVVAPAAILLGLSCSSESGDETGTVPTDCGEEKAALVALIEDNKTCTTDDDCQAIDSWCLMEGRVNCTGAFYFNRDVTGDQFAEADEAYTSCVSADAGSPASESCGTCLMGFLPAICDGGICVPGPEEYD